MNVVNITEARNNLFRIVESAHESHTPIFIKGKKNNVILIDEEDWKNIQETLYLSSIPGMIESIKEGLKSKPEDCVPYVFD